MVQQVARGNRESQVITPGGRNIRKDAVESGVMAGSQRPYSAGALAFRSEAPSLAQPRVHRDQAGTPSVVTRENLLDGGWVGLEPTVHCIDQARRSQIRGNSRPRVEESVTVNVLA